MKTPRVDSVYKKLHVEGQRRRKYPVNRILTVFFLTEYLRRHEKRKYLREYLRKYVNRVILTVFFPTEYLRRYEKSIYGSFNLISDN